MTAVPPPDVSSLRVRLIYHSDVPTEAGSRFYLKYAGATPSAGTLDTVATDIAAAWSAHLAQLVVTNFSLTEVDVLDITSDLGASGSWTGSDPGTYAGGEIPWSAATNVEYDIGRRYRGGKPRMFLPPPSQDAMQNGGNWSTTFVALVESAVPAFFTAVAAISVGSLGALSHINLSYYKGFTNVTNSSGREKAVPTYRAAALSDPVTGYAVKQEIGSQRRRRTSLTP
jgi:hypothetical protein